MSPLASACLTPLAPAADQPVIDQFKLCLTDSEMLAGARFRQLLHPRVCKERSLLCYLVTHGFGIVIALVPHMR